MTIRPITLSESAEIAAQRAMDTFTHEPNPYELGSPDYLEWHRVYTEEFMRLSAAKMEVVS